MRLVCPNCEAKYEVPDDAIPDTGRDVQCANCGHAWFQMRARATTAVPGAAAALAAMPGPVPEPMASPEPEAEPVVEALAEPVPEPVPEPVAEARAAGSDVLADLDPSPEAALADASNSAGLPEALSGAEADAQSEGTGSSPDSGEAQPAPEPGPEISLSVPEEALSTTAEAQDQDVDAPSATGPELVDAPLAADAATIVPSADEMLDGTALARAPLYAVPDALPENAKDGSAKDTGADTPDQAASPDTAAENEAPGTIAVVATGAAAYAVDESVLAILREEAEREATARRADAQSLETQTDLGLALGAKSKKSVTQAEAKPSARRDLLPDVEEINSTLRPSEPETDADRMGAGGGQSMPARQGFRGGFLTVMTVAIIGASLYTVAPWLEAMLPALSNPLQGYVTLIDSLRLHLDGLMRSATVAINGG